MYQRAFVDDVKDYIKIDDHNDSLCLQKVLDIITSLCDEWQLSVSVSKCNILTIGHNLSVTNYYIRDSV